MKELSIEQKAKAYDEVVNKLRRFMEQDIDPLITRADVQDFFPEVTKSEDERIRKELIFYLRYQHSISENFEDIGKWITWLEKQNSNVDNANKEYWRGYREGKQEILDKYAELEKQGEKNTNHKTIIVKFMCKKDWHGIGDYYYGKIYNGYPCEKEQKGYDIYDDNHIPTFCDEDFINEYFNIITEEKQSEQKHVWSEEDEKKIDSIIETIRIRKFEHPQLAPVYNGDINWLKSLKQRIGGKL